MSNVKIFNDRKNEEQLIYQNTKMINWQININSANVTNEYMCSLQ